MNPASLSAQRRMWLIVAIAIAAVVTATVVVVAQAPAVSGHHDSVTEPSARHAMASMPQRQQMMQNMTAADQKLAELIAAMNAATGDKKVDAIAAVVTELAAQHQRMMEQMISGMSAMHGSGGMMKGAPEPKKDATDPDHAAHHPEK